jgi:hypothetical protein
MTISDQDYYEIISEVGYPVVKEEDLEFQRSEIENYFIYPALREFFIWFPKKEVSSQYVTSTFSVNFPDESTYGLIDARINTSVTAEGATASPFINQLNFRVGGGSSNMYGTKNDYGVSEAKYLEKAFHQAQQAYVRAQRIDIDEMNRIVTGYTNVSGELILTWAKQTTNFNDVPFRRKTEVIELAKVKCLKGFAMLRGQLDSDVGVSFNSQDMISRADDLEDKVLSKWRDTTKVVVIRN